MVEHNLAKVGVVSSNLIARSKFQDRENTVSDGAKPLFAGDLGPPWKVPSEMGLQVALLNPNSVLFDVGRRRGDAGIVSLG